jgi:hypothetical protein
MIIEALQRELEDYELEILNARLDAEIFVYYYDYESYEGYGIGIWKKGNLYGYHSMGHCSCYGPVEDNFNPVTPYTESEMDKIIANDDYSYDHAPEVWARLKEIA